MGASEHTFTGLGTMHHQSSQQGAECQSAQQGVGCQSAQQAARGRRTCILLVPALCWRENVTGWTTRIITYSSDRPERDARDGEKLDGGQ